MTLQLSQLVHRLDHATRRCTAHLGRIVLALGLLGIVSSAKAEIGLYPSPQTPITAAPDFIAAADFNGDSNMDVAALESGSDTITLAYGTSDGTLGPTQGIPMAPRLLGFAAGDLNSDDIPDLVAVTNYLDSLYIAIGKGDGTFQSRIRYQVGQHPMAVAIGNFDRMNGNDLVTANQDADSISVLLNLGGNRGFSGQQEIHVGGNRPTRVATGDLDGDGADDIVVLNSGGIPNDLISVVLNSGTGHFKTQRSYRVGLRGMDIAIADVNNDGARDILVLNGKDISGRAASFTVSVFLNTLNTDVDPPVATGVFQAQPNILINCPQDLSGIGAFCDPEFITTGDYDANGRIDFAVSYEVFANSGTIFLTAGYVAAYSGEGDGTFSPAAQVSVGERPMGVATADFNKDALPDIAVAEEGERSVRVVTTVPPNQRSTGSPCTAGAECFSMYCVDGLCCESPACPEGQSCRVPGQTGHCSPVLANGLRCTADAQCGSNSCIEGVCCSSPQCAPFESCNLPGHEGKCAAPPTASATPAPTPTPTRPAAGMSCDPVSPTPCADTLFCNDGTCCATRNCPPGQRCDIFGMAGACAAPHPVGGACAKDTDCAAGLHCGLTGTCTSAATTPGTPPATPETPVPTRTAGNLCEGNCCAGDCDGDHVVTADELLTVIGIAVGDALIDLCPAGDMSGDGTITVDEILSALSNALDGCPT